MGETVHQKATYKTRCPVQALVRLVQHVLSNGGTTKMLLCDYYENESWSLVTSNDMISLVYASVKALKLHKNGIDTNLVGSHSLHAGGAMAMTLRNHPKATIKNGEMVIFNFPPIYTYTNSSFGQNFS